MAKGDRKMAKLASREINNQNSREYPCSVDGTKMVWVHYVGENGRGRSALRCEKCGAVKFRSDL
ncbi:MAG: hypothetical protein U9R33_04590 [candidate division NC10 bacterium]|nr:hypothetical protein [candidate division NC10 bacterium]